MAIGFNIQFRINEKTQTRVIRLTDTSTGFTLSKGNFSIIFPDGTSIQHTDFLSPDISSSGSYYEFQAPTDIYNNVLTGAYSITFVVVDNTSATYTLVKSFDFNWIKPTQNIINLSDTMIPEVKFQDLTVYGTSGSFSGSLTSRTFNVLMPTTSAVTGTTVTAASDTIDAKVSNNYYEGVYTPKSDIVVTYSASYTYNSSSFSVGILYTDLLQKDFSVKKAPTRLELITRINLFRTQVDAYKESNDTQFQILSEVYDILIALYSHLIERAQTSTLDGSQPILVEILDILDKYTPYTYQSAPISAFYIQAFGLGTVTSVGLSMPTGFSVSGSPITTSGSLGVTFASGYSIPTTIKQSNWDDSYTWVAAFPTQTGNTGKFLTTNGSFLSWATNPLGTVTSVGITAPSAFTVTNSPITSSGVIAISANGTSAQYITGAGALSTFLTDVRTGISLTTNGSLGAATYNSSTGVFNIPVYSGGFTSVVASASQVVLTATSSLENYVSGSGGQTFKLPDATTLVNGATFSFNNNQSSGTISVNNNSNTLVVSVPSGGYTDIMLIDNTTAAGTWDRHFSSPSNVSWSTNTFDYAGSITSATWNGNVVAINRGGTGASTASAALTNLGGQPLLSGTGFVKSTAGVISYDTNTYLTGITSGQVTTALGFTPYNATNPSNYIALTTLSSTATGLTYTNTTGVFSITSGYVIPTTTSATNWDTAYTNRITSLTTTGTSGAATLSGNTLNIPQYQSVLTNPITGTGTTNYVPKFSGTTALGNSAIQDSGTLITLGSNTTISSGSLGIGTTNLTNTVLNVAKAITGGTSSVSINNNGTIQSDVTVSALYNQTFANTQAATFTLGSIVHYFADQGTFGAGSSVTNQYGFRVNSTLIGATNNYGFRGGIPSGTNRWNLYMDGTADNYLAGSLGIGQTSLTGYVIRVNKALTGATTSYGMQIGSVINSDVTTTAYGFRTILNTQAASFTLTNLSHFTAAQGTIGAGSTVTTQTGFRVESTLNGATNNYAFKGEIASSANAWNIYMDGTANNYLAGDTTIGTTSLGTSTKLTVGGTETAASNIARGQLINPTLVASANNDVLVGLDINPTFTLGSFTGTTSAALRVNGNILNFGSLPSIGSSTQPFGTTFSVNLRSDSNLTLGSGYATSGDNGFRMFSSTRNIVIQNGGTFTDAGYRLDVFGTTRFTGTTASDNAPLGSELAAVTGTGTNWTLVGTNLNVGGYTHTVGSVVPLTTSLAAVSGTYYQITYTITGRTAGSITISYGGTSTSGVTTTGATGPLASSTAVLTITPTTDFDGTIVLSIKSIGTSSASSTFANSSGSANIEVRASSITTNTFIGLNAGSKNTTSNSSTFLGTNAGINSTSGIQNTFIGSGAGYNSSVSAFNTYVGAAAGYSNTTSTGNTFIGTYTGYLATGAANTALGSYAMDATTTGNSNTAIGSTALRGNTTGANNVAIGSVAGRYIADGTTANAITDNSIFIGNNTKALANNQTNQIVIGSNSTGLGSNTTVLGNSSTTLTALYGAVITGGTSVDASAQLQVDSTSKGVLFPRMTTTQKNAISSPSAGLVVYDTTLNKLCVRTASSWEVITSV